MTPSIADFVTDPQLLGLPVSPAQRTLLKAVYGLPLDGEELALWQQCTGRDRYPARPFAEVTVVAGARAGKDSRIASPIVVYEAVFGGHERHLARGERGVIVLVAQDQRATKVAFGYIRDYLTRSALLASQVVNSRLICATFSLPECAICWGTVSARVNPDRGGKESAISHGAKHDQVPEAAGTVQHADRRAGRL